MAFMSLALLGPKEKKQPGKAASTDSTCKAAGKNAKVLQSKNARRIKRNIITSSDEEQQANESNESCGDDGEDESCMYKTVSES